MKKLTYLISLLLVLLTVLSVGCFASANFNDEDITAELKSQNYYMLYLDEDYEVFSKGAKDHVQPAAMNKVLAAIVAIEEWGDLNESVTVTADDLSLRPDSVATNISIKEGETYTKLNLVQAMLIVSANDAESIIAYQLAGSKEAFAQKMNDCAKKIGCKDTKVVSIFGFDEEGQYTCAKDVATIMAYGLKNPTFKEIIELQTLTIPATNEYKEKSFLTRCTPALSSSQYNHPAIKGGKETFTGGSGRCIVTYSNQDGYSYITVVMNGSFDAEQSLNYANLDTKQMVTWVYKNLAMKTIADENSVVATLGVKGGKKSDVVQLSPKETVSILASKNVSVDSVLVELEDAMKDAVIPLPIAKGDVICKANIIYANKVIDTIELVAADNVVFSPIRRVLNALGAFFANGFIIFIEVIALLALLALLARYIKDIYFKDSEIAFFDKINTVIDKIKTLLNSLITGIKEKKGNKDEEIN